MKKLSFLLISVAFLFKSCGSFKKDLFKTGGKEEVIQNAITDFTNTSKLNKKDSVFDVSFQDTLYRMVLRRINKQNGEWLVGEPYSEIKSVSISAASMKMLITEDVKVGSKGKLASRYIEKNGNLFYWWDDDFPLTEETLAIFNKYNLLQNDEGGWIKFPDIIGNNSLEAVDYFFCRNDISNYKKIRTKKAIGYYDAPNLECDTQ